MKKCLMKIFTGAGYICLRKEFNSTFKAREDLKAEKQDYSDEFSVGIIEEDGRVVDVAAMLPTQGAVLLSEIKTTTMVNVTGLPHAPVLIWETTPARGRHFLRYPPITPKWGEEMAVLLIKNEDGGYAVFRDPYGDIADTRNIREKGGEYECFCHRHSAKVR